jgi:hypothetical protein
MSKRSIMQGRAQRLAVPATVAAVLLTCLSLLFAGAATASLVSGPGWEVDSREVPTNIKPGGYGMIIDDVYNIGKGETHGHVTLTDTLPPGLEIIQMGPEAPLGFISNEAVEEYEEYDEIEENEEREGKTTSGSYQLRSWECAGTRIVTCTTVPGYKGIMRPIKAGYMGRIGMFVKAVGPTSEGVNHVTVSGGGAPSPAEASSPISINPATPVFGLNNLFAWFSNADGTIDTQAGSHPYSLTVGFNLNAVEYHPAGGGLRNIKLSLPPGVIGDPHAVPQCTRQQFIGALTGGCPPDTQVGVDSPGINPESEEAWDDEEFRFPVYNLVPPPGVPAEFGFTAEGSNIIIEAEVRSGSDYGITANLHNLAYNPVFNSITFWGAPAEASHDFERCGIEGESATQCGWKSGGSVPKPLLTVPTSCEGPQRLGLSVDSWNSELGSSTISTSLQSPTGTPLGFQGCEHLSFGPTLTVAPDTSFADTPAGLTVDLKVPQEGLSLSEGTAASDIKDTTVTLPQGVAINPGQAAGLGACGPAEDGLTTESEKAEGKEDNGPAHCPNSSKVGTDEIETPLLSTPLKGSVYVMPSNPPHLQLLVTAEGEGVFLKLVGDVELNEKTGQLVTTFADTPSLPFTDFKLSFSGGAQAALTTPAQCGTYTTTSDFTAWSSPFVDDVFPTSAFAIAAGTNGASCPSGGLPFTPAMIAGSTTDQAGGFTDFSLLLTRQDDQQRIQALQFKTPEGLLGMISEVPLCPEAQANAGTCSSASQIGHTVVEAGPGPYPLVVPQPGQSPAPIYLTEGYKGAPYGLSIVVPLHVGPFTLQTQIVRAKIEVDPLTTQLTITTDPFPTIIDGIPADLRSINAVIDKPGFMFNPTGCDPSSFSGTATSTEGASAPISSHFQMGSCRSLTFKPDFKVSTSGKTSRTNGASLDAKIIYPTGALGANQASSQSNVASVKVDLPKQLPSRLTTLQKACLSATFEANPAACPAASRVGQATAVTPVLPVALSGPAYFVSYGNAKFPELVIVLQGYGVTVNLHGETFISKAGITSSTFHQVPDVPITSFELKLPEGPYSALAANGNLCKTKLVMPTVFTGHNGAVLRQNTPMSVAGCPKHKATKHKTKHKQKSKTKGGKRK